ncbi:EAL domain-containing protein [Paenibacillus sp. JCM 10914]|uniref:EAL domain-containing protein n=1 Tax=Paenibacillus sp. JCM 10914 TaxID=1236974 RepID=UPI0003CC65AF|nr:EAL domain-containing protein [Paenibacillus sp. JCM 10914]GAE08984.1 EAL domain protein [Paenibacillus sp. JCM 10914]
MICDNCSTFEPIEEQGTVHMRPACSELSDILAKNGYTVQENDEGCAVQYMERADLLDMVQCLQALPLQIRQSLSFCVTGGTAPQPRYTWSSMEMFKLQVEHYDMVNIIVHKQFTSYMQPIVDSFEQIVAYEFLLRPIEGGAAFQPYKLFETARKTGLQAYLDRAARTCAIETSAEWLPTGVKRFVNFLPSSIYDAQMCLSHTFHTIDRLHLDPRDFVFEVVETERIDDVKHLQSIFEVYRNHGISVAMDDVGAGYSTLEQMIRLKPDYVKIDRSLIDHCDENAAHQKQLETITKVAHDFGAMVLAEGIERREEFHFCRDIGIELSQGYLFGKPSERPPRDPQSQLIYN